jgi:hypothetical protein
METVINTLKKSPLFNLSLSSKELFHSNFLYWIGQNYPLEFGKLFADYLSVKPEDLSIKPADIFREKENIDLSFKYSNGQEILIENKVKSVPYFQQLEKYSENASVEKNYILLSLSYPSFFQSKDKLVINKATWYYLSYSELKNKLKSMSFNFSSEYHRNIIEDYCVFIEGLVKVNELCNLYEEDFFDFHSIGTNKVYERLQEIRLHDFYLKKKYELISFKIYNKLKEKGKRLIDFGSPLDWKSENSTIFIGHGMTRGQGFMDLKYLISSDVALGIQIQGDNYRMVVEDTNGSVANNFKEKLDSGFWFDFSRSFPNLIIHPKGKKEFNKYGNTFFYKSVKLGTGYKMNYIIDIVLSDVNQIEANFTKIKSLIEK